MIIYFFVGRNFNQLESMIAIINEARIGIKRLDLDVYIHKISIVFTYTVWIRGFGLTCIRCTSLPQGNPPPYPRCRYFCFCTCFTLLHQLFVTEAKNCRLLLHLRRHHMISISLKLMRTIHFADGHLRSVANSNNFLPINLNEFLLF